VSLEVNKENSPQFYQLELSTQPLGLRYHTLTTTTITYPDGHKETAISDQTEYKDQLAISALFGWRLGDLALRTGLIESRGGAAVDWIPSKKFRATGEIFDFARADFAAHGKISTRYYFSPSVYVTGGWDDFLNHSRKADSVFLGAGIRWNDDDIKYLLGTLAIRP
jgi:phospholipid/cholesterol/gamma-HCH transport system substrate-binding protein